MKVEIWSDLACPYCFIGKRRLELALEKVDFAGDVEIIWRSFELAPEAPQQSPLSKIEHLAEKYDQPKKWAELLCLSLAEQGKEININFDFEQLKVTNTLDAHRLLQLAKTLNKSDVLKEQLLLAGFESGKLLADKHVLSECGVAAGIEKERCEQVLSSNEFLSEVREDEQMAQEIGISSVPFFIIDEAYGMEGAQPVEHIQKMLTDIHNGAI
ncbi:MAG: DsbA family oxidoreductase [Gammaproteobacteria bacterium]|nr:DsbA family oxidoreductase [Gammaproteobacteria bacterium]